MPFLPCCYCFSAKSFYEKKKSDIHNVNRHISMCLKATLFKASLCTLLLGSQFLGPLLQSFSDVPVCALGLVP